MSFSHLASLIPSNARCVLAFSGGLDSTVLLHQLIYWQRQQTLLNLRVLHVHHGLSVNADSWASHCKQICHQWNIMCEVLYIKVNKFAGNLECNARNMRYKILFEKLQTGEYLLTAHNLNDQCETLLLALKRGSGPAGLSAMPLKNSFNGYIHVRPLLNFDRQQLKMYANLHKLSWKEDESNFNCYYDRNFLRLKIIPLLQAKWPHFNTAVARTAINCAEQEKLLDDLLSEQLARLIDKQGALDWFPLRNMSDSYCHVILRRWIAANQSDFIPSRAILKRIIHEVMYSRQDAQPCLHFSNYEIRRYRHKLYYLSKLPLPSTDIFIWHNRDYPLCLPKGLGELQAINNIAKWRHPTDNEQITIRFKASGYHHIVGYAHRRKIKKLWQDLGIPPWQRQRTPLIYYNEILIGAPKLFTTYEGVAKNNQGWQIIWKR
ncbi:tRNA lysidine(34) synthetase TilS [Pantoea sp. Mhis]|uniref:tRNA lysidine(34) synthetase TilS n=1 Tax=Pantoea sp. Mhis TaxID=2576759 RepID=UPI00135A2B9F|nr:tRNA lysidine(34) synthetase TilS [Pantoea sp. Mhis]MXP56364.1 tRNA lysidine(34) synthetase TilS [Pantoea sp. Mhis]